ncbi:MAG: hypothetical protein WEA09_07905 [Gemmatimonadota bacterium]
MRRFVDNQGRHWDLTLGRESWGAFYILFVPRASDTAILQTLLPSERAEEAEGMLNGMDDDALQEYLSKAEPKPMA